MRHSTIEQVVDRLLGGGDPTLPPHHLTEEWDLARYPDNGTSHLLIDGWLSVGSNTETDHLATRHLTHVEALDSAWQWPPRIKAFSYSAPGQSYEQYHSTMPTVEEHVQNLTGVLVSRQRWVITAYSLGAAIATLTVGRLSSQDPSLRDRIPLLVLVAPGLYGGPALVELLMGPKSPLALIPTIASELGEEAGQYPTEARDGIASILDAGVSIAVLYSPHDQFAPYRRLDDRRILHWETPAEQLGRAAGVDPFTSHLRMRTLPANHDQIYHLSKALLSLVRD